MLDDLLLFAEVVKRGSFAKSAEDLRLSPSTLSKRINALEKALGNSLMIRSARGVTLTSFGELVFNDVASSLRDIQSRLDNYTGKTINTLRILCPQNLVTGPLLSVFSEFQFAYPDITLHIEPNNKNSLLSQKPFDLAIRVGEQADSSFYQKRLGQIAIRIVGTKKNTINTHLFLPYVTEHFENKVLMNKSFDAFAHQSYIGDITFCRMLVAKGNGSAMLPMTEISELASDKIEGLHYQSEVIATRPIYAMWPNSTSPIPMAGRLIELLDAYCRKTEYLCGNSIAL